MNLTPPSVNLTPIKTNHSAYSFVEKLFVDAFPPDERRPLAAQRNNTDNNGRFRCLLATDGNRTPTGFITCWDLGLCLYVEHFATDPHMRGTGIGSAILQTLLSQSDKPVLLEVEHPDTDIARRRIGFYRRNGFELWDDVDYMQPPYAPGQSAVPLLLMATSGISRADAPDIIDNLHAQVYGARL